MPKHRIVGAKLNGLCLLLFLTLVVVGLWATGSVLQVFRHCASNEQPIAHQGTALRLKLTQLGLACDTWPTHKQEGHAKLRLGRNQQASYQHLGQTRRRPFLPSAQNHLWQPSACKRRCAVAFSSPWLAETEAWFCHAACNVAFQAHYAAALPLSWNAKLRSFTLGVFYLKRKKEYT